MLLPPGDKRCSPSPVLLLFALSSSAVFHPQTKFEHAADKRGIDDLHHAIVIYPVADDQVSTMPFSVWREHAFALAPAVRLLVEAVFTSPGSAGRRQVAFCRNALPAVRYSGRIRNLTVARRFENDQLLFTSAVEYCGIFYRAADHLRFFDL